MWGWRRTVECQGLGDSCRSRVQNKLRVFDNRKWGPEGWNWWSTGTRASARAVLPKQCSHELHFISMTDNTFCLLMTHYSNDFCQLYGLSQSKLNFLHGVPVKPTYTLWVGTPWGGERPVFRVGPLSQKEKEKVTGCKTNFKHPVAYVCKCWYVVTIWKYDTLKSPTYTGLDRPRAPGCWG